MGENCFLNLITSFITLERRFQRKKRKKRKEEEEKRRRGRKKKKICI
jgi:hypothetical protein